MAAQKTVMAQILCGAKWSAGTLLAMIAAFLLSAWAGSSIPRNPDWQEPETGVTIGVETNGIHTGIVMPLVASLDSGQIDWRKHFPLEHLGNPNREYTHVAVSFGEREVFLSTPRLEDVSLSTLAGAIYGGDGLIHATHYVRPKPDENYRELTITEAQYMRLVAAITHQMEPSGGVQVPGSYAGNDAFYDSSLTYHLGHTCNQWSSDLLAEAGVKTGWWTPLSGGLMKWVKQPE
jgi:uncharacterized protein (TIGR02117 family)